MNESFLIHSWAMRKRGEDEDRLKDWQEGTTLVAQGEWDEELGEIKDVFVQFRYQLISLVAMGLLMALLLALGWTVVMSCCVLGSAYLFALHLSDVETYTSSRTIRALHWYDLFNLPLDRSVIVAQVAVLVLAILLVWILHVPYYR
jgi:small-conductance mechanosensitive channel